MYALTTPKEEQKLCSNCAYSVHLFSGKGFECLADENKVGISRVDGEFIFGERDCVQQRAAECDVTTRLARCGREGVWWKPKPPERPHAIYDPRTGDGFDLDTGGAIKVGKSTMEL